MIPTPYKLSETCLRVFITCCDDDGIGRVGYVDLDSRDPTRVLGHAENPVLDIGRPGTFDENGVLACSVLREPAGRLYMYYVGFELGRRIRYRLLTGLAISDDNGKSFYRYSECPVLERSDRELYFRCGPFVLHEEGRFRMWYVAGSAWADVAGKEKPVYLIKYTESADGIAWPREGSSAFGTSQDEHGFGRPWIVHRRADRYEMYYSIRRRSLDAYRLGYALSCDGVAWERRDEELNLREGKSGFDDRAIMYSAIVELDGRSYCFYNGNDFGREGFAAATRDHSA